MDGFGASRRARCSVASRGPPFALFDVLGRTALDDGRNLRKALGMDTRAHRTGRRAARAAILLALVVVMAACGSNEGRTLPSTSHSTTTVSSARSSTLSPGTTAPPTTPTTPTTPSLPPVTVPSGPAVEVSRGPTARRAVALTFDAGSDVGFTGEVLDILVAESVPASFGITGTWAEANPVLVRRMGEVGQILNHTYDHRSFTGYSTGKGPLSPAERIWELDQAEAAIRSTGAPAAKPWFRPPYGDRDASVLADVGADGYHYMVMWSLDSLGWKGLSSDEIVARCLDDSAAQPGAIYLFHVGSQSADHAALPRIIEGLRSRGFTFETVAGLLEG